ncbi:VOC family protein [Paenibacillus piscarius]|uniref:VOC family protein n=1 Tax=Paenibacillus piscarius TaxID=1089681 RepID=UPI001EE97F82|nr:VOC family protein [Paenibacillus piscarius]
MKIKQLKLSTNHLEDMKTFYSEVLQMPVIQESNTSFAVSAGESIISFENNPRHVFYHYAFYVDELHFSRVLDTIQAHSPLLQDEEGQTEFFSGLWQRKQFYFRDPQGNILEILPSDERSAKADGWIRVQEIGLPVEHIDDLQTRIHMIKDEMARASETIAFYGNEYGVFVLVQEGRAWFPTEDAAIASPVEVIIEHDHALEVEYRNIRITAV